MSETGLNAQQLREVFRKIASGERRHGQFLTAFAQAYLSADNSNELLMAPIGRALIAKYKLEAYADGGTS